MGKEVDHVLKAGSEVKPKIWIAVIIGPCTRSSWWVWRWERWFRR